MSAMRDEIVQFLNDYLQVEKFSEIFYKRNSELRHFSAMYLTRYNTYTNTCINPMQRIRL